MSKHYVVVQDGYIHKFWQSKIFSSEIFVNRFESFKDASKAIRKEKLDKAYIYMCVGESYTQPPTVEAY